MFCAFCDAEATHVITHKDGTSTRACAACAAVYECGQNSPDAEISSIPMLFCGNCGEEVIPDQAGNCPTCGIYLSKPESV